MALLALASYAVRSVFRNRRTTASALAGLILGVAVAAAPWIALDSHARDLVAYYESGLPMDALAYGPSGGVDEAASSLRGVQSVETVEPLVTWGGTVNATQTGIPDASSFVFVMFVQPSFDGVADEIGVSWLAAPSAGLPLLHESFQALGIGVGDPFVLEHRIPIWDTNGTLIGWDVWNATVSVGGFYATPRADRSFYTAAMFFAAADLDPLRQQLNLTGQDLYGNLYIWVDRDALLDPFDLGGSAARLERQSILMDNALAPHGYTALWMSSTRGPTLPEIVSTIGLAMTVLRLLFVAFAIPTLAIAGLLTKASFEVGLAGRRRELAVLRARGLSSGGVRLHILGEVTVIASIAAVAGIALASILSLTLSPRVLLGGGTASPGSIAASPSTLLFAFLLAWALALVVARTPAKRAAAEDIVAGLKAFHPEEAGIDYRRSRDLLIAGVAAASLLLLLAWGSRPDSPLGPVEFLLGFSTAILVPVAPFLLTIALGRYLTRGTSRPYRILARIFRRSLGELHPLVERNLLRAPRRSSNAAMIVTFVLGFVVAVSSLVASSRAYRTETVLWSTPSDVIAEASNAAIPGLFNLSTLQAVVGIPGVAAATRVLSTFSDRGSVVLFDAADYLSTVPWLESRHLAGVDPAGLMGALAGGGRFAANTAFQTSSGLELGDPVTFRYLLETNATVALRAYVAALPGLAPPSYFGDSGAPLAYMDFSAVPNANLASTAVGRYLVSLDPGANASAVVTAIRDLFPPDVYVYTQLDALRQEALNPITGTVFDYLETQALLGVGILVVAIGLVVYSASAERRDEFATLVARGIDSASVRRLVMAEGWVVSILGMMLGAFGGLVTAITLLALVSLLTPSPIPLIVPATVLVPLALAVVGIWAAGVAGSFSIRRMDVARVLKLRGG